MSDERVSVSLRLNAEGHDWVKQEAAAQGITVTEMYRELFRLGARLWQVEQQGQH